ncbi:MAG: hypothetical protein K6B52_00930 [Clostridiales bacterium]|nr:hypothetical protein [Clostridiales bacterium]
MAEKIISFILAVIAAVTSFFSQINFFDNVSLTVDTARPGEEINFIFDNVNVWDMGTQFINAKNAEKNDIYDFVKYVQLMECTGGSYGRDLFKDPYNTGVLDDYDFTRLIENCRGILRLGAKPHIKVGNVPMKYSTGARTGNMQANLLEPDDYDVYYNYLTVLFTALVDEFGKEEMLTWHYGVMTEYENSDWFDCGDSEKTKLAFFKIYDYAVDAMQKTIGESIYVGAHSMTVTEGIWDEREFIEHAAVGTNLKTGKKGTRLCYLTFSYYEISAGNVGERLSFCECVDLLRQTAEKYGLDSLDYGVDEGRVLFGAKGKNSNELPSRTVGFQWQAGMDARLIKDSLDSGVKWISSWTFKSDGLNAGNPTLSYHIADCYSRWKGSKRLPVNKGGAGIFIKKNVNAIAAANGNKVFVMAYNEKNKVDYSRGADVKISIISPSDASSNAKITVYRINDECNFYDDWVKDKAFYGLKDEDFSWSPDCPCIGSNFVNRDAANLYNETLREKYAGCSRLVPEKHEAEIINGSVTVTDKIGGNEVVFYEISF